MCTYLGRQVLAGPALHHALPPAERQCVCARGGMLRCCLLGAGQASFVVACLEPPPPACGPPMPSVPPTTPTLPAVARVLPGPGQGHDAAGRPAQQRHGRAGAAVLQEGAAGHARQRASGLARAQGAGRQLPRGACVMTVGVGWDGMTAQRCSSEQAPACHHLAAWQMPEPATATATASCAEHCPAVPPVCTAHTNRTAGQWSVHLAAAYIHAHRRCSGCKGRPVACAPTNTARGLGCWRCRPSCRRGAGASSACHARCLPRPPSAAAPTTPPQRVGCLQAFRLDSTRPIAIFTLARQTYPPSATPAADGSSSAPASAGAKQRRSVLAVPRWARRTGGGRGARGAHGEARPVRVGTPARHPHGQRKDKDVCMCTCMPGGWSLPIR